MMGIVVPETCWAYKKYNKIISGIWLVSILQLVNIMSVYKTSQSFMNDCLAYEYIIFSETT